MEYEAFRKLLANFELLGGVKVSFVYFFLILFYFILLVFIFSFSSFKIRVVI